MPGLRRGYAARGVSENICPGFCFCFGFGCLPSTKKKNAFYRVGKSVRSSLGYMQMRWARLYL